MVIFLLFQLYPHFYILSTDNPFLFLIWNFFLTPCIFPSIFCICKRVCRYSANSTQVLPYRHFMVAAYLRISLLMGIPIPHALIQTSKISVGSLSKFILPGTNVTHWRSKFLFLYIAVYTCIFYYFEKKKMRRCRNLLTPPHLLTHSISF